MGFVIITGDGGKIVGGAIGACGGIVFRSMPAKKNKEFGLTLGQTQGLAQPMLLWSQHDCYLKSLHSSLLLGLKDKRDCWTYAHELEPEIQQNWKTSMLMTCYRSKNFVSPGRKKHKQTTIPKATRGKNQGMGNIEHALLPSPDFPPTQEERSAKDQSVMRGDLDEPANYKVALLDPKSDKWLNAMNVEMQSMKDKRSWVLVELPLKRQKPLVAVVFKKKTTWMKLYTPIKLRLVAKAL
ncbi:hypothetical protein Tco_1184813 [Tanacetum coccineum]